VERPAFTHHPKPIPIKATTLRLVIPTEAKRSGGTCGSLHPNRTSRKVTVFRLVIPTVAEGPAVLSIPIEPQGKPLSSDLSSRPKWRDLRFSPSQSNLKESHCLQTCHPDRSGGTCGSLHPAEILLDGDVRQSGAPRPANPCPGPDFSTQTIQVTTSFPAL
jgi:hypothetical protein